MLPLESPMGRIILSRLADPGYEFVFPSQTAANYWAMTIARSGAASSVEADRFVGWDRFTGRLAAENAGPGAIPADYRSRLLWAIDAIARHEREPFLRGLLKEGFAPSGRFADFLARMAPYLRSIASEAGKLADRETSPETADYLRLGESYARFLEYAGIYEPRQIDLADLHGRSPVVFGADLVPGFAGAAANLAACPLPLERHTVAEGFRDSSRPPPPLYRFDTYFQELAWTFSRCADLISAGTEPSDIAIFVPRLSPDAAAHMERAAKRRSVPVSLHSGRPLSSSPFGALLAALSEAESEGFSLSTLETLFCQPPFAWKKRDDATRLLGIARSFRIPEHCTDIRYAARLWKSTFAFCAPADAGARGLYESLRKSALQMRNAATFGALRGALFGFRSEFLDESGLPGRAQRTLERIFGEIDTLEALEKRAGTPPAPGRPFSFLLRLLERISYSPVDKGNSVQIHSFQAGALMAPGHSFVLDVSQESTHQFSGIFDDIPEELKEAAAFSLPENIGNTVLESFDIGDVSFCHAEKGLSGYSVPHPWFAGRGSKTVSVRSGDIPPFGDDLEAGAWMSGRADSLPDRLHAFQKEPAEAYLLPPNGEGGAPRRESLAHRAFSSGSLVSFNPREIRSFSLCPFSWVMGNLIKDIAAAGASAAAVIAEGSFIHDAIRRLMESAGEKTDKLPRDGTIEAEIDGVMRKCLVSALADSGPSLEPMLEAAFPRMRHRLRLLLEAEAGFEEEGWCIGSFEVPLSLRLDDLGILLQGRADRLAWADTGGCVPAGTAGDQGGFGDPAEEGAPVRPGRALAIIDYKRKTVPNRKEFLASEDGRLGDFQVAAYAEILARQGHEVSTALYWSVEKNRRKVVFGRNGEKASFADFGKERGILIGCLEAASRRLSEGKYMTVRTSAEGCAKCPWKPACRAHYASESL